MFFFDFVLYCIIRLVPLGTLRRFCCCENFFSMSCGYGVSMFLIPHISRVEFPLKIHTVHTYVHPSATRCKLSSLGVARNKNRGILKHLEELMWISNFIANPSHHPLAVCVSDDINIYHSLLLSILGLDLETPRACTDRPKWIGTKKKRRGGEGWGG